MLMNSRYMRHLQLSLLALDVLMINLVYLLERFVFYNFPPLAGRYEYSYLGLAFSAAWLLVSLVGNMYCEKNIVSLGLLTKKTVQNFVMVMGLVLCCVYFIPWFSASIGPVSIVLSCMALALVITRFIYLFIFLFFKRNKYLTDKVVIIGYNNVSKMLIDTLEKREANKEVIGICDEPENISELSHYPIISNIRDAFEMCRTQGVTEIYSSIAPEKNPEIYKLIHLADQNCIHFRIIPDMSVFVNSQAHMNFMGGMPVISLRNEPLVDLGNRIRKKLFDLAVGFFVTVLVLSWLVPLIALLIKLDSRGPVFFRQTRSGRGNRKFSCFKFRSMKVNDQAHEKQATRNDQRLTRVGKFLRSTNLDEFPQFINVLKGDMSVVGPRPHMLKHTEEYAQMADQFMIRHFLKPGITGWAQVNGYRGEIDSPDKLQNRIEHDIWYLENWSVYLDIKIMFLTVYNVVRGDKNAF
jgi:putative colanic acid biosynthesis UDP-glucose lipid carrier transferase